MMSKRSKKGPTAHVNKRKAPTPPELETFGIAFPDERSWNFFEELSRRTIRPTKFYHEETVKELGIENEMNKLIAGLDLEKFVEMSAKTYKRVTLEFLASARRMTVHEDGKETIELHFQAFNKQHTLTHEDINDFFSLFPNRCLVQPRDGIFG